MFRFNLFKGIGSKLGRLKNFKNSSVYIIIYYFSVFRRYSLHKSNILLGRIYNVITHKRPFII